MRQHKDDKKVVFRSLAMIMQFGLNMLVPICIMCALGIWLDRKLDTSFITIIMFVIGVVAGGQNIYRMAKSIYSDEEQDKERGVSGENNRKLKKEK